MRPSDVTSTSEASGHVTARDILAGAFVALPFLIYFLLNTKTFVFTGDSAELTIAVETLGVPHPTGYPVYILLGKVVTLLPALPLPVEVGLLSVLPTYASLVVLFSITTALTWGTLSRVERYSQRVPPRGSWDLRAGIVRYAPGTLAVVWLGGHSAVVRNTVKPEVYTLMLLFFLSSIASFVVYRQRSGRLWLVLGSLSIGLAVGTHLVVILILPAFAAFFLVHDRLGLRSYLTAASAWGVGVSPYLFTLFRPLVSTGYIHPQAEFYTTASRYTGSSNFVYNFVWYLTGGRWKSQNTASGGDFLGQVLSLGEHAAYWEGLHLLLLAVVGAVVFLWYAKRDYRLLVGGVVFTQVVFYLSFLWEEEGHILPFVSVVGVLIGCGLAVVGFEVTELADRLRPSDHSRGHLRVLVVLVLLLSAPVVGPIAADPRGDSSPRDSEHTQYAQTVLERVPSEAVLSNFYWSDKMILEYHQRLGDGDPSITTVDRCSRRHIDEERCYVRVQRGRGVSSEGLYQNVTLSRVAVVGQHELYRVNPENKSGGGYSLHER